MRATAETRSYAAALSVLASWHSHRIFQIYSTGGQRLGEYRGLALKAARRSATVAQAPPDRHLGSGAGGGPVWAVFWQELRTLGYSDQELAIEPRWAAGHEEHLPELVRLASEVIVAASAHRRWRPSMRPRRSRSSLPPPTIRSAPGSLPASRIRAAMSPGCRVCRRTLRGRSWSCSRLRFPVSSALPSWSNPGKPDPRRRAGGRATSGPNSAHRAPTGRGPRSRPGRSRSFPR
jgi:hypothetical protein